MKEKILIVEDEFIEANNLRLILEKAGYMICGIASSVTAALKILENEIPGMVLLDIYLKGSQTGIDLAVRLNQDGIPFVYLSANNSKEIFRAAKLTRPYGFLVKPFRQKDVLVTIDIAQYLHRYKLESKRSRTQNINPNVGSNNIIHHSPVMNSLLERVGVVAISDTSVLVLGESGTGKELIARAIHEMSPRREKPFIVINCGAIMSGLIESELFGHEKGAFTGAWEKRIGKFEMANGGTIFLDEIGELALDMQIKFLRVLQEREIERLGGNTHKVDIRVIAATNRDLENEVVSGRFRLDLYYRLNVFPVTVPALRTRLEDIPLLAAHFLEHFAKLNGKRITGFSESALAQLMGYPWPGNVRQLEHLVERSVLLASAGMITEIDLEQPTGADLRIPAQEGKIKTIEEIEAEHIITVLKYCNGKVSGFGGAADLLGLPNSTLTSKMKKLGIQREFRGQ